MLRVLCEVLCGPRLSLIPNRLEFLLEKYIQNIDHDIIMDLLLIVGQKIRKIILQQMDKNGKFIVNI